MKKLVFILIAVLLLIAIPITVYLVGKQQETRSKAAPATTLTFIPTVVTKQVGEQFSISVQMNTGANNVAAAELHILFDATVLEALSITSSNFAPKIAASGVVSPGSASITVAAENTTTPINGTGTIAVIQFRGKAPTAIPSLIKFDSTTFVSGLGEVTANVLTTTGISSVTIAGNASSTTSGISSVLDVSPTAAATTSSLITPTVSPLVVSPTIAPIATSGADIESTLSIQVEQDTAGIAPTTPLIQGTATPGSTVTIVIHSDPITTVVTADASGAWSYQQEDPLESGDHTITATAEAPDGTTETTSLSFTVSSDSVGGGLEGQDMPTSGNTFPIILSLIIGGVFIFISGLLRLIPVHQL